MSDGLPACVFSCIELTAGMLLLLLLLLLLVSMKALGLLIWTAVRKYVGTYYLQRLSPILTNIVVIWVPGK